MLSIIRTPEHSSACGGTRTAAGDYRLRAHSHSSGGAMPVDEADGQLYSTSYVPGNSDRQPRQSQYPGTCYSNTVSHLTVLVGAAGKVEPLAETERKRCCHTIAHLRAALRRSALCRPALAPGRTQSRLAAGGKSDRRKGHACLQYSGNHRMSNTQTPATVSILDALLLGRKSSAASSAIWRRA